MENLKLGFSLLKLLIIKATLREGYSFLIKPFNNMPQVISSCFFMNFLWYVPSKTKKFLQLMQKKSHMVKRQLKILLPYSAFVGYLFFTNIHFHARSQNDAMVTVFCLNDLNFILVSI